MKKTFLAAGLFALTAMTQFGCGGNGAGTGAGNQAGPTPATKSNTAAHVGSFALIQAGSTLSPFGKGLPIPLRPTSVGPVYESAIQLWMSASASGTTLTQSFYLDKAETQPAGNATYTLDTSSKTLTGTFNLTGGPYAGLSGNFTQTVTNHGTVGTYAFTLADGTTVSCSFTVLISSAGIPAGSGTETITEPNGFTETANIVYHSDGSTTIKATDSDGYSSTVNIAANGSGAGTLTGPDPGLPATVVWNSSGTGTVTFANLFTIRFTHWQLPNP